MTSSVRAWRSRTVPRCSLTVLEPISQFGHERRYFRQQLPGEKAERTDPLGQPIPGPSVQVDATGRCQQRRHECRVTHDLSGKTQKQVAIRADSVES